MCERCEQLEAQVADLKSKLIAAVWMIPDEVLAGDVQRMRDKLIADYLATQAYAARLREALDEACAVLFVVGMNDPVMDIGEVAAKAALVYKAVHKILSTPSPTAALDEHDEKVRREERRACLNRLEHVSLIRNAVPEDEIEIRNAILNDDRAARVAGEDDTATKGAAEPWDQQTLDSLPKKKIWMSGGQDG